MKKILLCLSLILVLVGCNQPTAKDGQLVNIDFEGKMNGEKFDGGSATNQILIIGSSQYIPGFEEGIIGMKEGQTKDVNLTFPTNYYEELAGKEVTFTITLNKIYQSVVKSCEEGDCVKIDYVGYMNGELLSGGKAEDQLVNVGAGRFIPGFEEGIIGMEIGETKDVNLTFPTNYYEELAGKEVTFKITLKEIYQ